MDAVLCLRQYAACRPVEESPAGKEIVIAGKAGAFHNVLHFRKSEFLGAVMNPAGHVRFFRVRTILFRQVFPHGRHPFGMVEPLGG